MSMAEALSEARQVEEEQKAAGFDQAALDNAARLGFSNGSFEETEDEVSELVEEFFPETGSGGGSGDAENGVARTKPSLQDKLDKKASDQSGAPL